MWECDCGVVPVVDSEGAVCGIVTDRDLCMAAYIQGSRLAEIPVWSVMSRDVHACDAEADVREAERLMRECQIRRLPVIDNRGRLIGVLSLGDVAQAVSKGPVVRQAGGEGAEFMQTVASVSEPRRTLHAS
jgi:CBS domain-containing protein